MAEPLPSRILSRGRRLSSSVEDFCWRLDTIENELRRLPQNLCVLLTHTPLTQEGSRYSMFEGEDRHRLGTHWLSEGELPCYPLVGQPPELFPFGTDRFPFGVVLSRTSSLLKLAVDAEDRAWLNFGGECGFYVSGATVRGSLPEGQVTHELTERTIWHYFAENTGNPVPEESSFESEYEQLLHCYHGIRETCMEFEDQLSLGDDELTRIIYELDWPEVLLYLGLSYPGPFFRVERSSVERRLPGEPVEPLISFGSEECHDVFRICPASVARATSYALEALGRMVHAVDEAASASQSLDAVSGGAGDTAKPSEAGGGGEESVSNTAAAEKPKNRTARGGAETKLIGALTKHHQYAEGGCMNWDPIGSNILAEKAEVGQGSANRFFNKWFGSAKKAKDGYQNYRIACNDKGKLIAILKTMNGDMRPGEVLFGRKVPDEAENPDHQGGTRRKPRASELHRHDDC